LAKPSTIVGTVFLDPNRSAQKDTAESGQRDVIVRLLDRSGKVIATTTTDASGSYGFAAGSGDYTVEILVPDGLGATNPIRQQIHVLGKQIPEHAADFGLAVNNANLALTGSSVGSLVLVGLVTILGGLFLLYGLRRRKYQG
jgi:LPXTG-motif cell wall-anchored protein